MDIEERRLHRRTRRDALRRNSWLLGTLLVAGIAAYGLIIARDTDAPGSRAELLGTALERSADARVAVAGFINRTRGYPSDNAAAGLPEPGAFADEDIVTITVDEGLIVIRLTSGQSLTLIPDVVEKGAIRWACDAPGVLPRDLPSDCRMAGSAE